MKIIGGASAISATDLPLKAQLIRSHNLTGVEPAILATELQINTRNTEMKAINFTPQTDCVVIERIEAPKTTASGIIIPDQAKPKMNEGMVLAVGQGIRNEKTGLRMPMTVKVGDKVLFNNFEVQDFCYEDRDYLIVHETDLCGIVE